MRSTTKIALASLIAIATSGLYASARADDVIPTPSPPSFDLVAEFGTKAECVPIQTVAHAMMIDEHRVGGRTLALADGMDQAFADQWRHIAHLAPVKVRIVLAHGFAIASEPGEVVIDTVEFDEQGCAISRTLLKGTAWDAILHRVSDGLEATAKDAI